jgi:hypothetical protein
MIDEATDNGLLDRDPIVYHSPGLPRRMNSLLFQVAMMADSVLVLSKACRVSSTGVMSAV